MKTTKISQDKKRTTLKAPPKTKDESVLETKAGQRAASNETLLDRVRKNSQGVSPEAKDIQDLADRFESALIMCSKPQLYYRDQFETISETSHNEDEQREANEDE